MILSVFFFKLMNVWCHTRWFRAVVPLSLRLQIPTAVESDHWGNHVESFCNGIRVRRSEPVSKHNPIFKGTWYYKMVASLLGGVHSHQIYTLPKELLGVCDQWKYGPTRGEGKKNHPMCKGKIEKWYKSICPFIQGKLLYRHCSRSASIMNFILA